MTYLTTTTVSTRTFLSKRPYLSTHVVARALVRAASRVYTGHIVNTFRALCFKHNMPWKEHGSDFANRVTIRDLGSHTVMIRQHSR
jgi:hypothetical protein